MYKLKKTCKIAKQVFKNQKPQYRLNIPIAFAEIMQLGENSQFELELTDSDTITARRIKT